MRQPSTDAFNRVPQGRENTGQAVVLQDRYDFVSMFAGYQQQVAKRRLEQQRVKAERDKKAKEKLSNIDIKGWARFDDQIASEIDQVKNFGIQLSEEGYDIEDPSSKAGKDFSQLLRGVDVHADMTNEMKAVYEKQKMQAATNPNKYDQEHFASALEQFNSFDDVEEAYEWMKSNSFLKESIDPFDLADGLSAAQYESVIEDGDVTTTNKRPDKTKVNRLFTNLLLQGEDSKKYLDRFVGEGKKFATTEDYVASLTEHLVNQSPSTYKRTEDEGSKGFEMNFNGGGGSFSNDKVRFDFQRTTDPTFSFNVKPNKDQDFLGIVPDTIPVGTPAVSVTVSGKQAPAKEYRYIGSDGERYMGQVRPSAVYKIDGELVMEGQLYHDQPEVNVNTGVGPLSMSMNQGDENAQKYQSVLVPLSEGTNKSSFEGHFGLSTKDLNSAFDGFEKNQEQEVEQTVETASLEFVETRMVDPYDFSAEVVEGVSNLLPEATFSEAEGEGGKKYREVQYKGKTYDLRDKGAQAALRALLKAKYIKD